ncbi:MAG: PAS domain S-box protein [Gemmatimonadales bacterium]|nr:PAS domain S-box protein [Gemmatimonadales bacterium]
MDASAHPAVALDAEGRIAACNAPWLATGFDRGAAAAAIGVGADYLGVCEGAAAGGDRWAGWAVDAVRDVRGGIAPERTGVYPCHSESDASWFQCRITALPPPIDGGVLVVHEDVTPVQVRLFELEESERRLREAEALAHLGSWELDLVRDRLVWSPEVWCLFGRDATPARPTYSDFLAAVHPDDRDLVDRTYRESVRSGRPYVVTHRVCRPDGSVRWVEERGTTECDMAGRPVRSLGTVQDVTEHYRLGEERDRHAELVEATTDLIWTATPEGEALFLNRALRERLGVEAAASTVCVFDLYPPETAAMLRAVALPEARRAGSWSGDVTLVGRHGARIPVSQVLLVHRGHGGADVVSSVCRDTRVETALAAAQARFEAFMERAPLSAWITTREGLVVYANRGYAEATGRDRAHVIGRRLDEQFDAERAAAYHAENLRVIDEGEVQVREEPGVGPDGAPGSYLVCRFPVPDLEGGGPVAGGLAIDQTALVAAQQAVAAERDHLAEVLNGLFGLVAVLDARGCVERANRTLASFAGLDAAEVAGLPFAEGPWFAGQPQAAAVAAAACRAALSGQRVREEVTLQGPDGSTHVFDGAFGPLRAADGRVVGALVFGVDVTERKSLEAQLLQAQKMEAIGRLAGGVAHDFNNILTAIMGHAELLLLDLAEGDPKRDDALEVRTAAERAAALTRQLLAFSRRSVSQPRVLRVGEVVRALEPMLRRLIGEQIELGVRLAPAAGAVRIDPTHVEQVVLNLVVNARDAMPRGGRLEVCVAPAGDGFVELSVADTGVGMDEAVQARIFEPFFTTKPAGVGTGLGLATVFGIVQQAGGQVRVASVPGVGSTFTIQLPVVAEAPTEGGGLRDASRQLPGGSETILVAEDDQAIRRLVRDLLRSRGYTVLDVGSGDEASGLTERYLGPIDLLISDVVMPRLNGPGLLARLRQRRPSLRALFMSGYAAELLPAGDLGATPLLSKPFTPLQLLVAVREVLDAPALAEAAGG